LTTNGYLYHFVRGYGRKACVRSFSFVTNGHNAVEGGRKDYRGEDV